MTESASYPFSMTGKKVLVTGASSGLGQHLAKVLARRGARLVITGRDATRLQATHAALEGENHLPVNADLTQADDRGRLIQAAGTVDGIVHCAGLQRHCPIRQLTEAMMTEMYAVNFLAPVMLTQGLLRTNAIRAKGSIIFMLSTAAHLGTRGLGPYSAMKSGLLGIIRCLALEQSRHGIRVNGISPSAIATPMWEAHQDLLEQQKLRHPLGLGTPDDVAHGAIYLLSDASRWVTGTSLVMDGGAVI
ncbi:SDR family NAD(P)-dependent oxidoreductase [Delftia lacustris]|uniref:NAD(P)-dependent dehydrogenase, short-chain alcohol dehydrogenase family n=1 Tax=Delftia lacustris TaxID=558537 RepID=A0A1H3SWK5_9BURK|nr:SDR family oxidoreductase [Delftia lacustris]SDZ41915.1 NAD(P)-dependent dehydrogenase, short-chain alcohol dehydrogenase family [Delftia lacustris]